MNGGGYGNKDSCFVGEGGGGGAELQSGSSRAIEYEPLACVRPTTDETTLPLPNRGGRTLQDEHGSECGIKPWFVPRQILLDNGQCVSVYAEVGADICGGDVRNIRWIG